jgi:hypothetical protein
VWVSRLRRQTFRIRLGKPNEINPDESWRRTGQRVELPRDERLVLIALGYSREDTGKENCEMSGVKRIRMVMAASVMLLGAGGLTEADAYTVYTLAAHSTWVEVSDFSLRFADFDGDKKFSLDELVPGTFSHMLHGYWPYNQFAGFDYDAITAVPSVDSYDVPLAFTDGGSGAANGGDKWTFLGWTVPFGTPREYGHTQSYYYWLWNYDVTPVPEPASMILLGSALVGLAACGRKKFSEK